MAVQLGPITKKIVVGVAKGVAHGTASAGAAYSMGMKLYQWAVIAGVQMAMAIGLELEKVLDKIFPDEEK